MEGGHWLVSLSGYFGGHAPTDEQGFLEFARSLPRRDLYEAIREARPISAAVTHKSPSSRWRHYERMERFPEGFVLLVNPGLLKAFTTYGLKSFFVPLPERANVSALPPAPA